MQNLNDLIRQRAELDEQIKVITTDARKKGNEAFPKVEYDYFVTSGKRLHSLYLYRTPTAESVAAVRAWFDEYSAAGCSYPYGMKPEELDGAKQGMTFWHVYDEFGNPMLISEGGGYVIVRGPDFGREPVMLTEAEELALLSGVFPESLIREEKSFA